MASKASVTAEVHYETDKASWRQVADDTRRMNQEWAAQLRRTGSAGGQMASSAALAARNAATRNTVFSGTGNAAADIETLAREYRTAALARVSPAMGMGVTGIALRQRQAPGIDRQQLSSLNNWNHLAGTGAVRTARLAAEQRRLAEAGSRAGMGVLAMSQAFEDFTMAGMKGALNNLPQIVQHFGGSSGLAGAATFAAASFYVLTKAYNMYLEATDQEESEEQQAARIRRVGEAAKETARRVSDAVEGYREAREDRTQRESDGRKHLEVELKQAQSLADAEMELAKARNAGMEGSARMRADAKTDREAEEASLERRIAYLKNLVSLDEAAVAESHERIKLMEREQSMLKKETFITRGSDGSVESRERYQASDEARGRIIDGQLEAERQRLRDLQKRMWESQSGISDAEHGRKIGGVNEKTRQELIRQDEEKERRESLQKLADFLSLMKSLLERARAGVESAVEDVKAAAKAREPGMRATREDAEIEHLRARGHTAAANRRQVRVTEKRRIEALKNEGFSEEEAKKIAGRERADAGRKTVSGDGPERGYIKGFEDAKGFGKPYTPSALDVAKKDRADRPTFAERQSADSGGSGNGANPVVNALKLLGTTLVTKFDEQMREQRKTAAEKLQPVPK